MVKCMWVLHTLSEEINFSKCMISSHKNSLGKSTQSYTKYHMKQALIRILNFLVKGSKINPYILIECHQMRNRLKVRLCVQSFCCGFYLPHTCLPKTYIHPVLMSLFDCNFINLSTWLYNYYYYHHLLKEGYNIKSKMPTQQKTTAKPKQYFHYHKTTRPSKQWKTSTINYIK